MDWGFDNDLVLIFGFVLVIIFISSFFSFMKAKSAHETIRELSSKGQPIAPELLRGLQDDDDRSGRGLLTGGFILIAIAVALAVFGMQIGAITGDDEVGPVLRTVAIFPGMIGAALLVSGAIANRSASNKAED